MLNGVSICLHSDVEGLNLSVTELKTIRDRYKNDKETFNMLNEIIADVYGALNGARRAEHKLVILKDKIDYEQKG